MQLSRPLLSGLNICLAPRGRTDIIYLVDFLKELHKLRVEGPHATERASVYPLYCTARTVAYSKERPRRSYDASLVPIRNLGIAQGTISPI